MSGKYLDVKLRFNAVSQAHAEILDIPCDEYVTPERYARFEHVACAFLRECKQAQTAMRDNAELRELSHLFNVTVYMIKTAQEAMA